MTFSSQRVAMLFLFFSLVLGAACPSPCHAAGWDVGPLASFNPFWTLVSPEASLPACVNAVREKQLLQGPAHASMQQRRVAVPYEVFAEFFAQSDAWPLWNVLFASVANTNTTFDVCSPLHGTFHILPNLNFGGASLAPPTIVRVQSTNSSLHLSWAYAFGDEAYGRHDYLISRADCGTSPSQSWLLSWEKASGPAIDATVESQLVEQHTLELATRAAMDGLRCLETVFAKTNALNREDVQTLCNQISPRQKWEQLIDGGFYAE